MSIEGWIAFGVLVAISAIRVGWLFWSRSSKRCGWCKYEAGTRARGDGRHVMNEHHTCWRGVK